MVFDVELLNLILYCVQQLGVALGLGAQTVMLFAYLSAFRDGIIDEHEAQFLRATRRVLFASFILMVISGICITVLHVLAGQGSTISTPAYEFKWLLIAVVILLTSALHVLPETLTEGLLGGTWYALFIVHILAPVTTWVNLLTLWGVWLLGFVMVWYVLVLSTRQRTRPQGRSSEAIALQKAGVVAAPPKKVRKPIFSFIRWGVKKEDAPPEPKLVTPAVMPSPQNFQPIRLDPIPRSQPVVTPEALAPVEVLVPITPAMPMQQIRTDAVPVAVRRTLPTVKSPASTTTDTPFLPQVPPLQPIPTIPPAPGTMPQARVPGQTPVLQKPEDLKPVAPEISPEMKLGLNVMPKSPDQLK